MLICSCISNVFIIQYKLNESETHPNESVNYNCVFGYILTVHIYHSRFFISHNLPKKLTRWTSINSSLIIPFPIQNDFYSNPAISILVYMHAKLTYCEMDLVESLAL